MAATLLDNFENLQSAAGLESLNSHTANNSYISGVFPTQDDVAAFQQLRLTPPDEGKFPHAYRWFHHIAFFNTDKKTTWVEGPLLEAKKSMKVEKPTAQNDDEDEIDLFGEDEEEVAKQAKELAASREAAKKAAGPKKKAVINKSSLVIEVKPNSIDTNLDDLAGMIKAIEISGLTWGESHNKVPLAFGLYKLHLSCVIIDDLVDTDGILEEIEVLGLDAEKAALKRDRRQAGDDDDDDDNDDDDDDDDSTAGFVQSAEILSFNKL